MRHAVILRWAALTGAATREKHVADNRRLKGPALKLEVSRPVRSSRLIQSGRMAAATASAMLPRSIKT